MLSVSCVNLAQYELSLKTINLEKEYENTLGRTTHILDTERIRVHCMERLLLKFENDGLRLQLDQANELVKSKNEEPYLQTQLHETRKEVKRLRAVIPTMSAEIGSLRVSASDHKLGFYDGPAFLSTTTGKNYVA